VQQEAAGRVNAALEAWLNELGLPGTPHAAAD
jgi:hypothetical protein